MNTPTKRCTKCSRELPCTAEFFHRNKNFADGYNYWCKACYRAYYRRNAEAIKSRTRIWELDHPQERSEWRHRWEQANRDRLNARQRERYRCNLEHNRACSRVKQQQWRARNPGKRREQDKKQRIKHQERRRNTFKRWQSANLDKMRIKKQRREARKLSLPATFTETEWRHCLEYFGCRCAVCGRPRGLWHTLAMDHWIPLSSPNCPGTVAANIVPLCHGEGGCNNAKSNHDAHEWLVSAFGRQKAKRIEQRITAYFEWLESQ